MPPTGTAQASSARWPRILLLLLAAILTVAALREGLRLAGRLPQLRISILGADTLRRAQDTVARSPDPTVRQARAALYASRRIIDAHLGRDPDPQSLVQDLAEIAGTSDRPGLTRVQLALARLIAAQDSGASPLDAARAAADALPPAASMDVSHHLAPLTAALSAGYAAARLDAPTSYSLALQTSGATHEMFLQAFAARLARLGPRPGDAPDESALRLCAALRAVLRSCVLEPGPLTLKLVAADLLARELSTDPDPTARQLSQDLARWRGEVRAALRARPLSVVAVREEPVLAPTPYVALLSSLAMCTWLAAALAGAALGSIGCAWGWLRPGPRSATIRAAASGALLVLIASGLGATLWSLAGADRIADEMRRDFSAWRHVWRHPLAAAALVLIAAYACARIGAARAGGTAFRRFGGILTLACPLLALALLLACLRANATWNEYNREVVAAQSDPVAALLGQGADRALDGLRSWNRG